MQSEYITMKMFIQLLLKFKIKTLSNQFFIDDMQFYGGVNNKIV